MTIKYTERSVEVIARAASRQYLVDHGLPEGPLFAFHTPADVFQRMSHDGRVWLCVGADGSSLDLCIDVNSGCVAEINRIDGRVWHINDSVQQFGESLSAFSSGLPFGPTSNDLEAAEAAADDFAQKLREIDATALLEDPGFWNYLLFDISNGDWSADQL